MESTAVRTPPAAIAAERLAYSFAATDAVVDVSLAVAPGTVHAVLGPNGAGKTTTLDMLTGLKQPAAGTVRILGGDPSARAARRRLRQAIGLVPQAGGHYPQLTVAETVSMHARLYPQGRPVADVLADVGLTALATRRYRNLSGGEQRRLDLAVALAGDPEVLVLDEPTTGLDPEARERLWQLVGRLREAGRTILLTTHYLEEAQALADEVTVIVCGRSVASGQASSLAERLGLSAQVEADIDGGGPLPESLADPVRWNGDIEFAGSTLRARLDEPLAYLARLHAWADESGARVRALSVRPPSLEDSYRALVAGSDGGAAV